MKILQLRRGAITLVDDEDYDKLNAMGRWKLFEGYVAQRVNGAYGGQLFMHNVISGNAPSGLCLDHIDGNKTNNMKQNHRFITHAANCLNSGKACVYPRTNGAFQVTVSNNCVGTFQTYEEAFREARNFKLKLFYCMVEPFRALNNHLTDEQFYSLR